MMRIGEMNLTSYANIEVLENFSGSEEIQAYRQRRLSRYQNHVEFIAKRCLSHSKSGKEMRILEVGSGNSGLLYALGNRIQNLMSYGVEISTSRWKFAEVWKADEKISNVQNLNINFSDLPANIGNLDCYIVIDNTFSYLAPENPEYPEMLLHQAFDKLNPGGFLLLDIINYEEQFKKGSHTIWNQFPDSDPFKYGLYSYDVIDQKNIVTKSVFIKRNFTEDIKIDVSHFYTKGDLETLVQAHGFEVSGIFSTFTEEKFDSVKSQRLILLARKIG